MKNLGIIIVFLFYSCSLERSIVPMEHMSDIKYPFATETMELPGGYQIAYTDMGSGPKTLLFIHGLGSYMPAWIKNLEELKSDYRCIAIDLPGYGKSGKGPYEGGMPFFARIVKDFIIKKELNNVILAGHSMGGQIAITAALGYPELIEGLVLIAPAGFETFHKGQRQWFRDVMTADLVKHTTVEAIKSNLAYNFYRLPEDAEFMITDRIAMRSAADFDWYCYIIPKCVEGMVDYPVYPFLPEVNQAVLVIFGQYDNLIPNRFLNGGPTEKIARMGAERLPNARLLMVPEAGHFVHFEKAEFVNKEIRKFLEGSL